MDNNKVLALKELLEAFNSKNFDLNAWKVKAILVFKKIFNASDEKIKLLEELFYDNSSWSLRDHSGGQLHDVVKEKAKSIIEASIIELNLNDSEPELLDYFRDNLTGNQYKKLQQLLENNNVNEESVTKYFSKIASSNKDLILAQYLLNKNK